MSVSDLDLPLLPSAEQIRRREFATVRRGYDPDQVRDYLTAVSTQVETLEKELRETRLSAGAQEPAAPDPSPPPQAAAPYEELAKRLAKVIETADTEAKRILDEAKADAGRMLEEARSEADRIRVDAQAHAEEARQQGNEALEKAKLEAQRTLSTLSSRHDNLVHQLHEMQSKLLSVAQDIEITIEDREPASLDDAPSAPAAPSDPDDSGAGSETSGRDLVDPRYEDLWVSTETVDLPDLTSLEIDFDEGETDR